MVAALIEQLERHLIATRPGYLGCLQPGVSEAALDAFQERFSLRLPEDFRCLYRWRNGQAIGCTESLHGNRMFCPLEEVADTKALLDGMVGEDFEDPRWWRLGWVPFLSNGGGDYLCLDVAAEDGGSQGQLIAFWHDWERRKVEFPSIEAWLAAMV